MSPALSILFALVVFATVSPNSGLKIDGKSKIDCYPDGAATEEACLKRGCLWDATPVDPGAPKCTFTDGVGYHVTGMIKGFGPTYQGNISRAPTPEVFTSTHNHSEFLVFGRETMGVINIGSGLGGVAKDDYGARFVREGQKTKVNQDNFPYMLQVQENPFGIKITRKESNFTIFDSTGIPGLTISDNYVQISTKLSTRNIYGLGEVTKTSLRHDITWKKFGIWNHDSSPDPVNKNGMNLYGFHPFYLGMEPDGKAHGIFFAVSAALNIAIQPDPDLITYRALANQIRIFWILGDSPDDVIEQYTRGIIGLPVLPPFWGLGYQLSRYGYKNTSEVEAVYNRNKAVGTPIDTYYVDIDYMDAHRDFTYDPVNFAGLPDFTRNTLHAENRKLVLITDPGIGTHPDNYKALQLGLEMDVFVKNSSGQPLTGVVWPGETYFPDFAHPNATKYWATLMAEFHGQVPFDGMWYDMNEPSNFVEGSTFGCEVNAANNPQFNPLTQPGQTLIHKTICNDAKTSIGDFGEVHPIYGALESYVGYTGAKIIEEKKRPFLLSRSTAPSSGRLTAHWSGDLYSNYAGMRYSLINMLEFGIFGIPWVGSDICGFHSDADEELCIRWHQLGIFYPFCRNHNDINFRDQDPAAWSPLGTQVMIGYLSARYAFLPTFYSEMVRAHLTGRPVARPMFFDFNRDPNTYGLDDQFMLAGVLVAPVMEANVTERPVYLPAGRWYNAQNNNEILDTLGETIVAPAGPFVLPMYVRGGEIVTISIPSKIETTEDVRQGPFSISAYLNGNGYAYGELYWDDGITPDVYEFGTYHKFEMTASVSCNRPTGFVLIKRSHFSQLPIDTPMLSNLCIYGVTDHPSNFTLNGNTIEKSYATYQAGSFCVNLLDTPFMLLDHFLFSFK